METEGKQVAYHRQNISPITDTQYNQEHKKAEVMANSHDYTQYILSNGLSNTLTRKYPPLFWRAEIEDSMWRVRGMYSILDKISQNFIAWLLVPFLLAQMVS